MDGLFSIPPLEQEAEKYPPRESANANPRLDPALSIPRGRCSGKANACDLTAGRRLSMMITGFDRPPSALEKRKRSHMRKVVAFRYFSRVLEVPLYLVDGKLEDWTVAGAKKPRAKPSFRLLSFCKGILFVLHACRNCISTTVGRESEAVQNSSQKLRNSFSSHTHFAEGNPQHNLSLDAVLHKV